MCTFVRVPALTRDSRKISNYVVWEHFFMLIFLDIWVIPVLIPVVLSGYRGVALFRDPSFSSRNSEVTRKLTVLGHFFQLLRDIPCLLLGLFPLCLPHRTPRVLRALRPQPDESYKKFLQDGMYARVFEQFLRSLVDIAVLLGAALVAVFIYRIPSFISAILISCQRPSRDVNTVVNVHTVTPLFSNQTKGTRIRFQARPNGRDFDPATARHSLVLYVLAADFDRSFWRACENGLGETKVNIGRALLPLKLSTKFLEDPSTVSEQNLASCAPRFAFLCYRYYSSC